MPFVIRGVQEGKPEKKFVDSNAFTLVGECFVHGIMYGDALKDTNTTRTLETFLLL